MNKNIEAWICLVFPCSMLFESHFQVNTGYRGQVFVQAWGVKSYHDLLGLTWICRAAIWSLWWVEGYHKGHVLIVYLQNTIRPDFPFSLITNWHRVQSGSESLSDWLAALVCCGGGGKHHMLKIVLELSNRSLEKGTNGYWITYCNHHTSFLIFTLLFF